MAKVIEIDLSTQGINQAIKEVKEYQQWIARKKTELMRRLAEEGMEVAELYFSTAQYAGTNDVKVRMAWDTNGAEIIAEGKAVAFIEFGSGVTRGNGYPGVKPPEVSAIGSYGQGKGSTGKGWVYKGDAGNSGHEIEGKPGLVVTRGNPPARAMYMAAREVEIILQRVAKEVFST